MALFKLFRGPSADLPTSGDLLKDGYAFFCTDDGKFVINYKDGVDGDGNDIIKQKRVNASELDSIAKDLEKLGLDIEEIKAAIAAQTDWDQSDNTAVDFIKNKPFYDTRVILREKEQYVLTGTSESEHVADRKALFPEDTIVKLGYYSWGPENGVDYSHIVYFCQSEEEILIGECPRKYLDVEIVVSFEDDSHIYMYSADRRILSSQETGYVVNEVIVPEIYEGELKQLDEKYIPDSIANKEWVENHVTTNVKDGKVTGSLQQIADGVENGFDFTNKNSKATALDSSLDGIIPYGATGEFASSFGGKSAAIGKRSHAEGTTTIAKGKYSHAEGDNSVTLGHDSHAEGYATVTGPDGTAQHAEGIFTQALGNAAHAEGNDTEAVGDYSHAEGNGTHALNYNAHAEGLNTTASGGNSHAEGSGTEASGMCSHAEGAKSIASGEYAHAEGYKSEAKGLHTHAEGRGSIAEGEKSHAEGNYTQALGYASHSEGDHTIARGDHSHASGYATEANGYAQTVIGKVNAIKGDEVLFIVGNGSGDHVHKTPSNAFEVYQDGRVKSYVDLTKVTLENNDLTTVAYTTTLVDNAIKSILGDDVHEAYDTFKEIQELLAIDETGASALISQVVDNAKNISTNADEIGQLKEYIQKLEERVAELEAKLDFEELLIDGGSADIQLAVLDNTVLL